jgi:hypothetical protein
MRICLSAAKKIGWPSQSMTGLLGHSAARPLPDADCARPAANEFGQPDRAEPPILANL